jgi:predicted SnoaL-like aldol condensation-catalyzing enzyme
MRRMSLALAALLLLAGPAGAAGSPQEIANKQAVLEFYQKALNLKDFAAAVPYLWPRYIQHNPGVADGPEGLRALIQFLRTKFPRAHSDIKAAFADGDYVILHVHSVREPNMRGTAIMDIFKLESGKIVEHWDVRQEVPETAANANGMF